MNREQRRAQRRETLKKLNRAHGFSVSKDGVIEIPIAESDDKLVVDTTDFAVTSALYDLFHKFGNIEQSYKEEYDKAFSTPDDEGGIDAKFQLMKKIIYDFSDYVDQIFGEGACIKIFGHKYPQVVQISEFIEDFKPIAAAIIEASGITDMMTGAVEAQDTPAAPPLHVVSQA